jgi:hypothetical protein
LLFQILWSTRHSFLHDESDERTFIIKYVFLKCVHIQSDSAASRGRFQAIFSLKVSLKFLCVHAHAAARLGHEEPICNPLSFPLPQSSFTFTNPDNALPCRAAPFFLGLIPISHHHTTKNTFLVVTVFGDVGDEESGSCG